jgi:hypothetical protein
MKWGIFDAGQKVRASVEWQNLQKFGRIYKKCIRGCFALAGMEDFL